MNWVYNHYFGEGRGIEKDAPQPVRLRLLAAVLGREWSDLLKLNLLFIACSLPIITLPAAYFAMVSICVTMIEDRNVYLWRDFWSAFRARLPITTMFGLLIGGGVGLSILAIGTYAEAAKNSLVLVMPLTIALSVSVLLPLFCMHVFVALAKGGDRPLAEILKASAIGLIARPLPGLAALFVMALFWLAQVYSYPASAVLPVLTNFSLGALVSSFAVLKGVQFGFSHIGVKPEQSRPGRPKTHSA